MSLQSIRNRLAQLKKDKANLVKSLSSEREKTRKKQAEINQISRSVNKNTSESSFRSKQRQVESKERQISGYESTASNLDKKIAGKESDILKKQNELDRALEQAQRKQDSEDQRRRNKELNHSRNMSRAAEHQSFLHSRMSASPIVIKFEELPEKITVLFIGTNPIDQASLQLDEEIRLIQQKIRESEYRDSVDLKSIWATRPTDLLLAINEHKPTIVHFSGHGSDQDELILQDDEGNSQPVSKETIVEMFKVVSNGIELIVFNTCFSEGQASDVTEFISAAIGMRNPIGDEAARVFAAQLYSGIGFGKSIGEAYGQAKVALMLQNIPEKDTPQLSIADGLNENDIVLVKP